MSYFSLVLVVLMLGKTYLYYSVHGENSVKLPQKLPTVGISVLVRNKAHTLPYFLSSLMELTYPKDRLYVRFYCDHNSDNSLDILEDWIEKFGSLYHRTYLVESSTSLPLYEDEINPTQWSPKRFEHVIQLREDALDFARKEWTDYVFMLDADVFLESSTLEALVDEGLPVAAPMLDSDGTYSNFWCATRNEFYYEQCEDYHDILDRREDFVGCHKVPMVHTAVLISMQYQLSDKLTYMPAKAQGYSGPAEDKIIFANNARRIGYPLYICNTRHFGWVSRPPKSGRNASFELEALLNVKLQAIGMGTPLPLHPDLASYVTYPPPDLLNCTKIFMINLERRPDRRRLMEQNFKELGMTVEVVKAVDARMLDEEALEKWNVTVLPDYQDPYTKRPIKTGEIACFLSHYKIWEEIAKKGYNLTMILEDDVRFVPYFRFRFLGMMQELIGDDFDLLYLGRKAMLQGAERPVTAHTARPLYSYWTLGYLLTAKGARKLLAARPLEAMLPVDEFLPIMFDRHPNEQWVSWFPKRGLRALSAAPLLIHPTHYTGMPGYISDTEDSPIVINT